MMVREQVVEVVASYLHRTRWQRDRPPRQLARDVLKLIADVEAGVYVEPSPEEMARRLADAKMQRKRHRESKLPQTSNRQVTR